MKKLLTILLVVLCAFAAFAGSFKPYLLTLDLHPAILNGFCPTYIGVGGDYGFNLSNGDKIHVNASIAGGITERALFQDPITGDYLDQSKPEVELVDIVSFAWDVHGIYELSDKLSFSLGYKGIYEIRKNSMLIEGKFWPKNQKTERWLGGSQKQNLGFSLDQWFEHYGVEDRKSAVYPEYEVDKNVFTIIHSEVEYNEMIDTMVANEGFLAQAKINYLPGLVNKYANTFSFNLDLIGAKTLLDMRFMSGLNMFAISLIDRIDINYTVGSKVPTFFQQSISLGRKVRGFNTGSYASEFTAVNNFEVRFSSPEPIDGIFLRTNLFFDCGIGTGKKFNTDLKVEKPNLLASVGIQEQIDYNDAFDLGLEVAYLLAGTNARDPLHKLQIGATFFLDF